LKRPPSRTGASRPAGKQKSNKDNVVQLFDRKPKPKKLKPQRPVTTKVRKAPVRKFNSSVARLRPKSSFGKKVFVAVSASLVALVVLVIVTVFSPLLAVTKIEVVGTSMVSEKSVMKDLDSLKGKPLPQVTNEEVAQRLSKYELIDSVSVVSVPPNTLRVVVTERTAIAIVVINNIRYLYDNRLPVIAGAGNPATSKSFSRSIDVILSLPLSLLPEVDWIRATSKDNVVLSLRKNGQSILWGDSSAPGLKAEVLLALMKHYKRSLNITFDVSSPNQPSVY
jgi:cell division protein FtsQ